MTKLSPIRGTDIDAPVNLPDHSVVSWVVDAAIALLKLRLGHVLRQIGNHRVKLRFGGVRCKKFLQSQGAPLRIGGNLLKAYAGTVGGQIDEAEAAPPAGVQKLLEFADGRTDPLVCKEFEPGRNDEMQPGVVPPPSSTVWP